MERKKTVEGYIKAHPEWEAALKQLRSLIQASELSETIKWGVPVYTLDNKNVVGIAAFKSYVGIWFYQGVFLKDPNKLLLNAQEGKTRGLRQMRFNSPEEIDDQIILSYVQEAIQNQKAGKEIKINSAKKIEIPQELDQAFMNQPELKTNFDTFTPGKQREFAEYISEAKRSETRLKRLEKIIPLILQGIGLNDKYKS